MRVIFLSPHSDPQARLGEPDAGGQCVYEHELAIELAKNGIQVITFCRQRNHHEALTRVTPGYTIHRITAAGEGFIPKERIGATLPEFTHKVAKIIKETGEDPETVIHAHYWDGAAAALYLKANFYDYPLIWTPHSLGYVKREKYHGLDNEKFYHFIPRLMWESYGALIANHTIVLSKNEKTKLVRYYGAKSTRISVIPPGVSIGKVDQAEKYRRQWGIEEGARVLLCVGRMSRNKGYHHAIRILSSMQNRYSGSVKLVIVGGSSLLNSEEEREYQRRLKLLARKLGVADKVIFQPSVEHSEIESIYSLADIYLMTSENEPFGLTPIEAMAVGKVVIANKRGGAKDILINGVTGYLRDIHKYEECAVLVSKLLASPKRMARISERARRVVQEKYSWEGRLPTYVSVYDNIKKIVPTRLKQIVAYDHYLRTNLTLS